MALKIRLRQQGRTNRATYRLVVTDSRNPRDGRYLETLGWYNPVEVEADKNMNLKSERVQHWLDLGATLSERAQILVSKAAPHVIKALKDKVIAKKAKEAEKRKARKKAKA